MNNTNLWLLLGLGLFCATAKAQEKPVRGYVFSKAGSPLAGVNIAYPDSQLGTISGKEGYFQLRALPSADSIVFSYTGYQTQTVPADQPMPLQIKLHPTVYQLGEVVVTGFGQQERRRLTGAVSKTEARSFERIPTNSWQQALQGQLPGVSITPASGGPGAASSIRIRGVGSINANNQPLIVLDGIVLPAQNGSWTLGFQTNPLLTLNPEDIASVEVLRDAASTAIYGAQAANGVLLITTKQGQARAKPRLRMSYYAGAASISNRFDLLNGPEYARLWNQAAQNAGFTNLLYDDPAAQPSVDWPSQLLQRGFLQQGHLSLQGGNANTQYYVSGTLRTEDGYLKTTRQQRYNLRANLQHRIDEHWSAGLMLAPAHVKDRRAGHHYLGSPLGWASWFYPNARAFNERGGIIREPLYTDIGTGGLNGNPLVVLTDQESIINTQQILGTGWVEFAPLPHLRFKASLSGESTRESEDGYNGPATFFGRNGGSASRLHQHQSSLQAAGQLDWQPQLKAPHELQLTAGSQYIRQDFIVDFAFGNGLNSVQIPLLTGVNQLNEYFTERFSAAFLGYFARARYAYRGRYLLGLSARYDGSSRFGQEQRYGFFPAVSAGWIAVDRPLRQGYAVNFLKVRSSLGLTGNAGIGDFAAHGLARFGRSYLGETGSVAFSLANEALGWEENLQWNTGLDLGLLDGRLNASLDFFIRDTRQLLLETPVPATNGFSSLLSNAGQIRNTGLELELDAKLLRGPLRWNLQLNGAWLRNRVRALPDTDGDGMANDIILSDHSLFRPGQPAGAFYLVRYAGVDPENGDALYYDLEGNTLPNQAPATNRQVTGSPIPDFTGGMGHQLRYGRWMLSAFFHFRLGHQKYSLNTLIQDNMGNGFNQLRSQLDAWTPDNRVTDVPQARLWQINGSQPSTRYLFDAGFLRLQNLSLSYDWPVNKNQLRLYATAQNLWTWTRYPGLDPNTEFGHIQSAAQGYDLFSLPASRIITFGIEYTL
jgi:TonB-dependent starch-binding outer membrane protein SusC